MKPERFDAAVVGAGILGLAHAYHLACTGRRVLVIERSERARGASIRNFGMIWPIGQPRGPMRDCALRSRGLWLGIACKSGIWHDACGSLHVAQNPLEAAVIEELAAAIETEAGRILSPAEALAKCPMLRADELVSALWSETEICVDPRQAIAMLPGFLEHEYGVRFFFGAAVRHIRLPEIEAGGQTFHAGEALVCAGDDLQTLYPDALAEAGLVRCKLQMMRTSPLRDGQRLGTMVAGGLTLRHYGAFADCPSLPALRAQVSREMPEMDRFGIHVMASQNGLGEITIGDSHEYGEAIEPFDKPEIDRLILQYLGTFLDLPAHTITERWHGTYCKHPKRSFVVLSPEPGVRIVTGVGGAGMTLSFGLAEQVISGQID